MINKMIRNTILEIAIVILLVIITMFIWPILNKNMNYSLTNALAHESELELILNNVDGYDNVIVNNSYRTNKEYAVLLVTEKNCDNEYITINNQAYQLLDFSKEARKDEYVYVLATDALTSSRKGYKIRLNLTNKKTKYHYELKDLTYF